MKKTSPEIEEYLELLVRFKEEGKKARTTEIAKELKITSASVSEMFKKLEKKGFIKLIPYKGAELTKEGESIGTKILSKHRLLEKFLLLLGVKKKHIHGEACALEHALSDEVENAIRQAMHNSNVSRNNIVKLSSLRKDQSGKILFLLAGKDACKRLMDMGLTPNTKVSLVRKASLGPLQLLVRNHTVAIGRDLSEKVYVEIEI